MKTLTHENVHEFADALRTFAKNQRHGGYGFLALHDERGTYPRVEVKEEAEFDKPDWVDKNPDPIRVSGDTLVFSFGRCLYPLTIGQTHFAVYPASIVWEIVSGAGIHIRRQIFNASMGIEVSRSRR